MGHTVHKPVAGLPVRVDIYRRQRRLPARYADAVRAARLGRRRDYRNIGDIGSQFGHDRDLYGVFNQADDLAHTFGILSVDRAALLVPG